MELLKDNKVEVFFFFSFLLSVLSVLSFPSSFPDPFPSFSFICSLYNSYFSFYSLATLIFCLMKKSDKD